MNANPGYMENIKQEQARDARDGVSLGSLLHYV